MAYSINQVQLIGNLGRDAEIKSTANGQSVCILNLATSESWMDKNTQQWVQETEWHRVVFYGKTADALAALQLRKGETLYVSGKIKTRKWTDQQGVEKTVVEIVGDTFVPHRERNAQPLNNQQRQPQQQQHRQPQQQYRQPQQQPQQYRQQPQQQQQYQQSNQQPQADDWGDNDLPF